MVKTFILGAEYDQSELVDVVLRDEPLTLKFVKASGEHINKDYCSVYVRVWDGNDTYESYHYPLLNDQSVVIGTDVIKPGRTDIAVVEEYASVDTKIWTVPSIIFVEQKDVFTGSDVIGKILDLLTDIDAIKNKLNILEPIVDRLSKINFDPLT